MNRRVLILIAACVTMVAAWWLTRDGDSAASAKRPATRTAKGSANEGKDPAGRSGYDNFKLIHTRNVFDPDRRAPRTGPAPTPPPAIAKADYVALTGTFFDGERKQLAFFTGSRPEYNKVLTVKEKIAGATINKITGSNVEVLRDGQPIVVMVGQTVPFDRSAPAAAPAPAPPDPATGDETSAPAAPAAPANAAGGAPPVVGAVPTGPAPPVTASASNPGAAKTSPPPISSGKQDEVRRRMEERRRKEQQ